VIPFFAFPEEVRKVVYTTNAVESLHMILRKIIKTGRASTQIHGGPHAVRPIRSSDGLRAILQIPSVTLFEITPILQAFQVSDSDNDLPDTSNQLLLFDFRPGQY
jgi:hypothetical protein